MSHPLVFGVGVNDADYVVSPSRSENGKITFKYICPIYARWIAILRRCYHAPSRPNRPTYEGCTVSQEWHRFSAFKDWMESQDWQGKDVDKDLLVKGNKVYGPDTCCLISRSINCLVREIAKNTKNEHSLPPGVDFDPKLQKYRSRAHCVITGKRKHFGYFATPAEAHSVWLGFKRDQAEILAQGQADPRVAIALRGLYASDHPPPFPTHRVTHHLEATMAYPYLGDHRLEPDDDSFECPWCGAQPCNQFALMQHLKRCPVKAAQDEPEAA